MAGSMAERKEAGLPAAVTGTELSPERIDVFLAAWEAKGRVEGTLQWYRRGLEQLYKALPEEKKIGRGTLEAWRESLLEQGYAASTVNLYISASNTYLEYEGHREYQLKTVLRPETAERPPELARSEYLRLLQTAKALNREQAYLLVKVFGTMGLPLQDLEKLTVEAVEAGELEGQKLPECLREELGDYIARLGLRQGPVFVTRAGKALSRTNVTTRIRNLCGPARVAEAKGNPRCLRKLYLRTRTGIEENVAQIIEQTYQHQLEQEQLLVGWKDGD